jgi:hypothetical protein
MTVIIEGGVDWPAIAASVVGPLVGALGIWIG